MGLLTGIEFTAPKKMVLRAMYEAFGKVHAAMFGQIMVMKMFREKNILTQICGNNFMVLKAAPPLVVTEEQLAEFVTAIRDMVEIADSSASFWTEALGSGTARSEYLEAMRLIDDQNAHQETRPLAE